MALDINLKINKTDLLFQQNAECEILLTNSGTAPVEILHPAFNVHQPIFRVVHAKSGAEILFQPELPFGVEPQWETLQPKVSSAHALSLSSRVRFAGPGEYQISIICEYDKGLRRAESNAVRVNLARTTARNLTLCNADKTVFTAAWVNLVPDKPQLLRMRVDLTRKGGIQRLDPVAEGTLNTSARLSVGQNQAVPPSQWIGWIEDRKLHALSCSEEFPPIPPKTLDLAGDRHELVSPLLADEDAADPSGHANGAALVCIGMRDQANAQLQIFSLTKAAIVPGARAAIPGEFPDWITSHVNSKGIRRVYFIHREQNKSVLYVMAWPGYSDPPGPPRKLASWDGAFVAADSIIDSDDAVMGNVVLSTGPENARQMRFVFWQNDAAEKFSEPATGDIPYDYSVGLISGKLRMMQNGHWGILLRAKNGEIRFFDQIRKLISLPAPWNLTPLPIDLMFYRQDVPLFVCGVENCGIQLIKLDGKPVSFKLG